MPHRLICDECSAAFVTETYPPDMPALCPDCAADRAARPIDVEIRLSPADFALIEREAAKTTLILPDFLSICAVEMVRLIAANPAAHHNPGVHQVDPAAPRIPAPPHRVNLGNQPG